MCKIREINHDLNKSCQGETTCEWLSVRGYISDMWACFFFSRHYDRSWDGPTLRGVKVRRIVWQGDEGSHNLS